MGEIVINHRVDELPGGFVIIKNDEEETTFKQLKVYGDTTVLHPLNPKYADMEIKKGHRYQIIGKVVEKRGIDAMEQ